MHFSKLRLVGFKSFVEPTDILIDSGITGVVGPNGCGKSNVIEALRWVMGETSAKRMRGSEMDDVIFGGSAMRPARNVAEVTLLLDNSERRAPAPFNETEEIEVTRRIERGSGSTYLVNGKEVRARDVQLLFADLATGAGSTAIVSQGRVGALIGAKPTERRVLLEEAAGIRGLHSRRHEAELRLRAAETNLERLDDVIGALETQHQGLQRQARQANRYRRLSEHLRRHEAILLHLRWTEAGRDVAAARERLGIAEQDVHAKAEASAAAARAQADAAAALPPLRQKEAEAAAELQRVLVAQRELESEGERVRQTLEQLSGRLGQIAGDIAREEALRTDANTAIERLTAEAQDIEAQREGEGERLAAARAAADAAAQVVEEKEAELSQLTEEVAGVEAQRNTLQRQVRESGARSETLATRLARTVEDRETAERGLAEVGDAEAADRAVAEVEVRVDAARTAAADAEAALSRARAAEAEAMEAFEAADRSARESLREAEHETARLEAEIAALQAIVEQPAAEGAAPIVSAVAVAHGYEAALGAAFGEDLDASDDSDAAIFWAALPPFADAPPLPEGVEPLAAHVDGPPALSRRLSQVGLVADAAAGEALQPRLRPGQRLVSRDGALWRWDGYVVREGAETAAAKRLQQKNRLEELRERHARAAARLAEAKAVADSKVSAARETLEAVQSDAEHAAGRDGAARRALQEGYQELDRVRREQSALTARAADLRSRIASLEEARERIEAELAEAAERTAAAEQAIAVLEDPVAARERINALRVRLSELRTDLLDKRSACDRLERDAERRAERLAGIAGEMQSWEGRRDGAERQLGDLAGRRRNLEAERATLESRPAEIAEQQRRMIDVVAEAEARRRTAGDRLAEAEQAQTAADRALREAESALSSAREERVRREAEVAQAELSAKAVAERIDERLETTPDKVLEVTGMRDGDPLPAREDVERKLERLVRERDNMGPVNLRAEQEAAELEEQIASMLSEREDLLAAIARLRQGIGALNREGRERLLAAFEQVNGHFQHLFVRLFGGGEARLSLTEADDPLEAGLEIMASPPGKKMQVMSLLSGGEQALTALALLFAVFLTNPAPICILDEVDAPLDDSNVDRFCALLDEIAHSGDTRFLIVTHHRLTMARVDRLFGVTMAERGVSQLVSVDLQQAERLRESA